MLRMCEFAQRLTSSWDTGCRRALRDIASLRTAKKGRYDGDTLAFNRDRFERANLRTRRNRPVRLLHFEIDAITGRAVPSRHGQYAGSPPLIHWCVRAV